MTSVIRYAELVNATGAALTPTTGLVQYGKEGGEKYFKRTFANADIGNAAGQTIDATNPCTGCLLVTIAGAKIKEVGGLLLLRPIATRGTTFNQVLFSTATPHFYKYGWNISADGYSLYLLDIGDDATTQIVANDFVTFSLIFGNY
jgi:hypothetical protein